MGCFGEVVELRDLVVMGMEMWGVGDVEVMGEGGVGVGGGVV